MASSFTIRNALTDPLFRRWMQKNPGPAKYRVFVEREKWSQAEFGSYPEAYRFLATQLRDPEVQDAALNRPGRATRQPVVRDALGRRVKWDPLDLPLGYRWCPHCRRHTRFGYFRFHRMGRLKPSRVEDGVRRCVICGCSERMARRGSR